MNRSLLLSTIGALSLTALAATSQAASVVTVNMNGAANVHDVILMEKGPGGFERSVWSYNIAGIGTTTLIDPASTSATSYFLIGLYDLNGVSHLFLTMSQSAADARQGMLFSEAFVPYHESPIVAAVKAVNAGASQSDPSIASSLAVLRAFGNDYSDQLYIGFNDRGIAAHFTAITVTGATGVPLPAGAASGGALLGALGLIGIARKLRKPTAA